LRWSSTGRASRSARVGGAGRHVDPETIGLDTPVAERTARLSPKATPRLPSGVGRGEALAIDYPGDTLVDMAIGRYLEVAVARGAFYISSLALVFDEGATCAQTLMPESLTREQGVAYVTKREYRDGATADSVHLRQEAVAVPYVRAIDDLSSMLHEMEIWSTKHPARCRPEAPPKLRVFAQSRSAASTTSTRSSAHWRSGWARASVSRTATP